MSRWLSGRAVPTSDQAEQWAQTCGTEITTMLLLWKAAVAAEPPRPEPVDPPAPVPPPRRRRWRWIAAGVAVVAAAAAFAVFHAGRPVAAGASPTRPRWCGTDAPVTVNVPAETRLTSTITVHVACSPPAGDEYILFVEVLDVGDDHHSLFLPKTYLGRPDPGDYTYEHDLFKSMVRTRRYLYVVDISTAVAADWKTNIQNNLQFSLPPDARIVSNRAPNTKVA